MITTFFNLETLIARLHTIVALAEGETVFDQMCSYLSFCSRKLLIQF